MMECRCINIFTDVNTNSIKCDPCCSAGRKNPLTCHCSTLKGFYLAVCLCVSDGVGRRAAAGQQVHHRQQPCVLWQIWMWGVTGQDCTSMRSALKPRCCQWRAGLQFDLENRFLSRLQEDGEQVSTKFGTSLSSYKQITITKCLQPHRCLVSVKWKDHRKYLNPFSSKPMSWRREQAEYLLHVWL